MKVFNINNPKNFIERIIKSCHGTVEMVNEDGMHIELTNEYKNPDLVPFAYMKGRIDEMELSFTDSRDAVMVLSYLANMNLATS